MVRSVLCAAIAAFTATPAAAQVTLQPGETLLEVQAEGYAFYAPDMATMSIGVVSTGTTAREATDSNARTMAAVIAAVKAAGVEGRYVRTQQINVQPRFARMSPNDFEGQASITGYVARNSLVVTITKIAVAPDVISAAFGAGANSVAGPNLAAQDPQAGVARAREEAIVNARAEAETYAKSFGMRIARVLRVSERGGSIRTDDIGMLPRVQSLASAPTPPPTPVMGGEMMRTTTVWVDFALVK